MYCIKVLTGLMHLSLLFVLVLVFLGGGIGSCWGFVFILVGINGLTFDTTVLEFDF